MIDEDDGRDQRNDRIIRTASAAAGGLIGLGAGGPAGAAIGAATAERGANYLLRSRSSDGDDDRVYEAADEAEDEVSEEDE